MNKVELQTVGCARGSEAMHSLVSVEVVFERKRRGVDKLLHLVDTTLAGACCSPSRYKKNINSDDQGVA